MERDTRYTNEKNERSTIPSQEVIDKYLLKDDTGVEVPFVPEQHKDHPSKKIQDGILKKWGCELFDRRVPDLPLNVISELTYEIQKAATLDAMRTIEEERSSQESHKDHVRNAGLMPSEAFVKRP